LHCNLAKDLVAVIKRHILVFGSISSWACNLN
jgi:hypothetical protein